MKGGRGFNEGVLPTQAPSSLPMHINNHVWEIDVSFNVRLSVCKLVFFNCLFTDFTRNILIHNLKAPLLFLRQWIACYKKQELYTKCLAQTIQTYMYHIHVHVDIKLVLGRWFCFICNSGFVFLLCHPDFFVTTCMYITFHRIIISPPPLSSRCWEVNMFLALQDLLAFSLPFSYFWEYFLLI